MLVTPPHKEEHFRGSESLRDIVIGMADGLTVPFALAAGLSGAVDQTFIVVAAGLAEIAAGSISMGLGGYLAGRSEREHYKSELAREYREIVERPKDEEKEVRDILEQHGLHAKESKLVVERLKKNPKEYVDFMMRFELGLEEPNPRRALTSGLTIAGAYIAGGLIPLSPYFFSESARAALPFSIGVTLVALAIFGFIKGRFTGISPLKSSIQTILIGGIAAAAAFLLARLIASS